MKIKSFKRLMLILTGVVAIQAGSALVNETIALTCYKNCPHGFTHQCVHYVTGDQCDSGTTATDCCGNLY